MQIKKTGISPGLFVFSWNFTTIERPSPSPAWSF